MTHRNITHIDRIDHTAATPVIVNHRKQLVNPTTLITDPTGNLVIGIHYDRQSRLWREPLTGRTWSTTELLELTDDYYECAECGRVCDAEIDEPTALLHDRYYCGSCWGAKVDRWAEGGL